MEKCISVQTLEFVLSLEIGGLVGKKENLRDNFVWLNCLNSFTFWPFVNKDTMAYTI